MTEHLDITGTDFALLAEEELISILYRDRHVPDVPDHRLNDISHEDLLNPNANDERFYAAVPDLVKEVRSLIGVHNDTPIDFDIDCYSLMIVPPYKKVSAAIANVPR